MTEFNRKEFLNLLLLSSALPAAYSLKRRLRFGKQGQKNVLIILFDAWTAKNINLYGYDRETMPNLTALSESAIVYHQHRAGGNYTTPGTASLLTGTYPWTHRAIRLNSGVEKSRKNHNIFSAFEGYHRMAYTQNPVANELLLQFRSSIDDLIPPGKFFFLNDFLINSVFNEDRHIARLGRTMAVDIREGKANTLFLSYIYEYFQQRQNEYMEKEYGPMFPAGVPSISGSNFFAIEDGVDGVVSKAVEAPRPFLGYFHFFPPHDPYRPRMDMFEKFKEDDLYLPIKPPHLFTRDVSEDAANYYRRMYDEYLSYVDAEMGRLVSLLKEKGILDDTVLVLTADHGEMFERGLRGHFNETMYEPLLRIPLLIFDPDNEKRIDIHSPTSAIDVLPTLLHLTNRPVPEWVEGQLLRPYQTGLPDLRRRIFSVEAKYSNPDKPLHRATIAMLRWPFKIIYYLGYEKMKKKGLDDYIELYNVELDPDELIDLKDIEPVLAQELRHELLAHLKRENLRYE